MTHTEDQLRDLLLCYQPAPETTNPDWADVVALSQTRTRRRGRRLGLSAWRLGIVLVPTALAAVALGLLATGPLNSWISNSPIHATSVGRVWRQRVIDPKKLILATRLVPGADRTNPAQHIDTLRVLVPTGMNGPEEAVADWQSSVDAIAARYATKPPSVYVYGIGQTYSRNDLNSTLFGERVQYATSFQATTPSVAKATALQRARAHGLIVRSVHVSQNGGEVVVMLTATPSTTNLKQYLKTHEYAAAQLGLTGAAVLVQIVDRHNTVVVVDSTGGRDAASYTWCRQGLCHIPG